MRARVLKIEGERVTLGVYYQGEWWRVHAMTRIQLEPMSWIEGDLVFPGDGTEVYFRIAEGQGRTDTQTDVDPPFDGSIDLEA